MPPFTSLFHLLLVHSSISVLPLQKFLPSFSLKSLPQKSMNPSSKPGGSFKQISKKSMNPSSKPGGSFRQISKNSMNPSSKPGKVSKEIPSQAPMDPIQREKHRALRKYKRTQLLQILFQYCLTAYVFGLFLSKAFPSLFSFLSHCFIIPLSFMGYYLIGPKFLFIACNVIIFIIFRESKLFGSPPSSSSSPELYDEFMKYSRSARKGPAVEEKVKDRKLQASPVEKFADPDGAIVEEHHQEAEEENPDAEEENPEAAEESAVIEEGEKFEAEENDLPPEEFQRRIEEFIRKNRQMMLEAEILACGG